MSRVIEYIPSCPWRLRVPVLAFALLVWCMAGAAAPINVYLTYRDAPSESIVVNYHLEQRLRDAPEPVVYFDVQSRGGDKTAYAHQQSGMKKEMIQLPVYRTINWITLTGLQPDTVYYFIAGDDENGYTEERSFRTIPEAGMPFRFVTGGDMNVGPRTDRLLAQAGKQDPLFCAIGGDIAYVNGEVWNYEKWDAWFRSYDSLLRTSDGHMVPMLVGIGNHETNKLLTEDPVIKAPFYTAYFSEQQADGMTYFSIQFGDVLFLLLDSGHVAPHSGEQTAWLAQTLAANREMPHIFALYHVPLYPSHRPFDGYLSEQGRVHWQPYFEAYNIRAAFENHDHKLKRSKLLRQGVPDETGILYLGDGCFGVEPRPIPPDDQRDYLEVHAVEGHVWVVDVAPASVHYRAIGEQGELLDEYRQELDAPTPARARAASN